MNKLQQALLWTWDKAGIKIRKNEESLDNKEAEMRVRLFRPYERGEMCFIKSIPKRFLIDADKQTWKLTRKLQHRYTGPHKIIEVKNPVVYKIMVNGKAKMCHASKMKRDPASNKRFEVYEDDVYDTLLGDDELEIEDLEYMRRMNDLEYPTEDGLTDTDILPIEVDNELVNDMEESGDTEVDYSNGNDHTEANLTNLERPDMETVEGYDDTLYI